MDFTPKSEADLRQPAPAGTYDFEVLEADDDVSKSGNDMIKVVLGVFDPATGNIKWRVFDYLLASMEAKLRHFCDSVGLLSKYENGTLQAGDCRGRSGKAKIIIEIDKEDKYPPKNVAKDYVCRPAKALSAPKPGAAPAPAPAPVQQAAAQAPGPYSEADLPF